MTTSGSFKLGKDVLELKKPNGFTLLESIFSLSILVLITSFITPLILFMLSQLETERDLTILYQHLHDQARAHQSPPFKKEIDGYYIEQLKKEEICGWSSKNKKCLPLAE